MVVEVPLTQGHVSLIDDEDAELVLPLKWYALDKKDGRVYAATFKGIDDKTTFLHRFLLRPPADLVVDHINRDTLDNRRSNIRAVTPTQNRANGIGTARRQFKGVCFDSGRGLWRARIKIEGKELTLGRFMTIEEAARAYDIAAYDAWGEYARLNFPDLNEPSKGIR